MSDEFLKKLNTVHFIGIGGIGVSALVRFFIGKGIKATGSDRDGSMITDELEKLGVKVFVGHNASNISEDVSAVVYSPAIPDSNPEIQFAREHNIPTYSYPEALGLISEGMRTVAVSGTHGKTTTTAMITEMLVGNKMDPTAIVGSLLKGANSNFVSGKSDLFVVEACEYKRSFLCLSPEVLIITNIDNDHLDYYKDIDDIISAFHQIAVMVPAHGYIIADMRDKNVGKALEGVDAKIIDYSKIGDISTFNLSVSGEHNIKNAQAALAVAEILNIPYDNALSELRKFSGTWRRMEYKGELASGVKIYDDYAHHPTEIKATLQGFRSEFPDAEIRVVFQPHLYSRTKLLLDDFSESFFDASEVMVAPIYAAREKPDPEIAAQILADRISQNYPNLKVHAFDNFKEIEEHLKESLRAGDVIITMGAGDIYKVGDALLG